MMIFRSRPVFILILLFGAYTSSLAQSPIKVSEWKIVKSVDKLAHVFAPLPMQVRVDSIETDIGQVITVHHILQQSLEFSPNFLFHFSYTIYPSEVIFRDSSDLVEDLLTTTVENSVLMQNGELLYTAKKDFKDYPGRIWKTKYDNDAFVMKSEAYVADDRLYIIQVGSAANTDVGEAVDHFLDSFRIISSGL